jgi:exo-beta-1,3-glucanase (GH17 family)
MDLETRIAQIIKGVEATERKSEEEAAAVALAASSAPSSSTTTTTTTSSSSRSRSGSRKDGRQAFQTRPYNEDGTGGEDVMDDEELHTLLGV